MKDELIDKLRATRVGHEAENLSGQFFAGTLLWTIFRALVDLFIVWSIVLVLVLRHFLPPDVSFWIAAALYAVAVFLGGYVTTRLTRTNRFQASALLTALFLISLAIVLLRSGIGGLLTSGALLGSFFLLFWGYRAALR